MKFVEWMDDLPYIVKIIFCLPGLDLIWAIYRIVKGAEKKQCRTPCCRYFMGSIRLVHFMDFRLSDNTCFR